MTDRVELVNQKGGTSIHIDAGLEANGDLQISGQDLGEVPMEIYGDMDYEYWLTVPATEKDKLLLALLEKHYSGDAMVVSSLRDLMESKQIRYQLFSS